MTKPILPPDTTSPSNEPSPAVENAEKVLTEVRTQTAMPLLEIAAQTGIRGVELEEAVKKLEAENLVTVQKPEDPLQTIVSVSVGLTEENR